MILIRRLLVGEGALFRGIRLAALKADPKAFGSSYESALKRTSESWDAQADASAAGDLRATFLAFDGESAVGITAFYRDASDPSRGELLQVWVDSRFRGIGLAGRLMEEALSWARGVGVELALAGVSTTNHRVIAFYEKHGFEYVSALSVDDTTYLQKPLSI